MSSMAIVETDRPFSRPLEGQIAFVGPAKHLDRAVIR